MRVARPFWLFLGFSVAFAQPAPKVEYGKTECAYCRMILYDRKFGGELETKAGEVLVFDAIECIAASLYRNWNVPRADVKAIRFIDYENPGKQIDSAKARLVRTKQVVSPMGLNIVALRSRSAAKRMTQDAEATAMSWDDCIEFVRGYWRLPPPPRGGAEGDGPQ